MLDSSIYSYSRAQLQTALRARSVSAEHADTLLARAYRRRTSKVYNPLPRHFLIKDDFFTEPLKVDAEHHSSYDQSVKFRLRCMDEKLIESVLMPEKSRITLCLSTQVGCAQACAFCHTGRMGLIRQLTTAEIVGQVSIAKRWLEDHPDWHPNLKRTITNIVFMGMGEPCDNLEALIPAIQILTEPRGLAIGLRHISVSTAGHIDGIRRLHELWPKLPIAISLHQPFDAERSRLMPINRRWPLSELVKTIKSISATNPILIQYTMIRGVNDSTTHAQELVRLFQGIDVKINLIPLNEVDATRFQAPSAEIIQGFRDILHAAALRTMVRYSKGQDIAGACGQLVDQGQLRPRGSGNAENSLIR